MLKNDIDYIYDVEPVMDLEHFTELMLASLANKNRTPYFNFNFNETKKKTAVLPTNYKQIIEEIMFCQNGWGIKFAKLIEISKYYEEQSDWELDLGNTLDKYLKTGDKKAKYDFEFDEILIDYTTKEIKNIMKKYDEEILSIMDHFTNLIQSFSKNRYHDMINKECKRERERIYIKNGDNSYSNKWKIKD